MMGNTDELRQKIEDMDEVNTSNRKMVDLNQVKIQR